MAPDQVKYFSPTPWHPVGCRCGECQEDTGAPLPPHVHEDDFDADTCEICFPVPA